MTEHLDIYFYRNTQLIQVVTKRDNLNSIILDKIEQKELLNYLLLHKGE